MLLFNESDFLFCLISFILILLLYSLLSSSITASVSIYFLSNFPNIKIFLNLFIFIFNSSISFKSLISFIVKSSNFFFNKTNLTLNSCSILKISSFDDIKISLSSSLVNSACLNSLILYFASFIKYSILFISFSILNFKSLISVIPATNLSYFSFFSFSALIFPF